MTYADWLGQSAPRRVLIDLVKSDGEVERIADGTYRTGSADTPPHTLYRAVLLNAVEIEEELHGVLDRRGGTNGGEVVVLNEGGALSHWLDEDWDSAVIRYGDPSWAFADFVIEGTARIAAVRGDDDVQLRIELVDLVEDLNTEAQQVPHWFGQIIGQMRPLNYGANLNVSPPLTGTSNPDYYVHEANTVEDPVLARYVNQAPSTSPSVVNVQDNYFELDFMPSGSLTIDTEGVKDSGGTWINTLGAALNHLITRSVDVLFGYAQGGGSDHIILDERASDVDDAYNGLTVKCVSQDKPAPPWTSPETGQTCADYIGAEHKLIIADTWDGDVATRAKGDLYHVNLPGEDNHVGALDPAQVDAAAYSQLDTDLGAHGVSIWIDRGQSVLDVLREQLGRAAWFTMTPAGKLSVGLLPNPDTAVADLALSESQIRGDLEVWRDEPPVYDLALGWGRNNTVATGSHDTLDTERAIFVQREYQYVRDQDLAIKEAHPNARALEVGTPFSGLTETQREWDRWWALFSVPRRWYRVPTLLSPLSVPLGSVINVTYPQWGLQTGKNLVMITRHKNLSAGETELLLWG